MRNLSQLLFFIILCTMLLTSSVFAQGNQDEPAVYLPLITHSETTVVQLELTPLTSAVFDRPTEITHAGDGSGRLFITELPGQIFILDNGSLAAAPFLDIRNLVLAGGERGLLGLAFHPDYENNGYFFVNYTRAGDGDSVIARYQVSDTDPDQADPTSAQILLIIDQPSTNHNGGKLAFGPDGYLYIASGDGGGAGDPDNYAQSTDTLLGKILRLDVDSGSPYTIPPDNPFNSGGGLPEIWALGLRNPWRFSFDALLGDLYIADVGQSEWEEINFQAAGAAGGVNYGWHCFEGTHVYNTQEPCDDPAYLAGLTMPVIEYPHGPDRSVTGGYVYRGQLQPEMVGRYFYGDFISGRIWYTYPRTDGSFATPLLAAEDTGILISTFGEDEQGELYVADFNAGGIYALSAQP